MVFSSGPSEVNQVRYKLKQWSPGWNKAEGIMQKIQAGRYLE